MCACVFMRMHVSGQGEPPGCGPCPFQGLDSSAAHEARLREWAARPQQWRHLQNWGVLEPRLSIKKEQSRAPRPAPPHPRRRFDPLWNSLVVAGFYSGRPFLGSVSMIGTNYTDAHVATGAAARSSCAPLPLRL